MAARSSAAGTTALFFALTVATADAQMSPLRYPSVRGGQIRIEGSLVPAVTSWPAYPAWSPDGREIAFTMDGHLWVVPVDGGDAEQVTSSPGYDFEPDWSPDGRSLAFSRDVGGNLDVYVVPREGGDARRLTSHPALELHPRFDPDGAIVYASAVDGQFDVYRVPAAGGAPVPVVAWPTNEIQPDPRADGSLVVLSTRSAQLGSGGLWHGEREIFVEESSFRARPAWSPDGSRIVFASERAGTRDLWVIPAEGGVPLQLTRDGEADELAPSWSPDGERIVYQTNRGGVGRLEIASLHGGRRRPVEIRGRRYRAPTGRLRVELAGPARVSIRTGDGRFHAPADVFRRVVSFTETHYFHARDDFELHLPPGAVTVSAVRGPEYEPVERVVTVSADALAEVRLDPERFVDMPALGWHSGDTHVHDLHGGDVILSPEALVLQAESEDVHVVNSLIHVDGTKLMGDLARFSAEPHAASTDTVLLRYGQEYRMPFGHRTVLNNEAMFFPLVSALRGTSAALPFPPLFDYLRRLKAEQPRVLAGVPHPYFGYLARGELPERGAPSEIPADVALGLVDYFDVNCIWSDERGTASIYHKLLNTGFRLPAAGGSDTFSDLWRDPPLGTGRTYVHTGGELTLGAWYEGLKAGRSFSTNGPLLELDVEGRGMGEEIRLERAGELRVEARARSFVPMRRLEVIVNGEAVATVEGDARELEWSGNVPAERSLWIAVVAEGDSSPRVTDSYLYAHSTPVYVDVGGAPVVVEADRAYLERYLDALIAYARDEVDWSAQPGGGEKRELTLRGFEEARDVFRRLR